MAFGFWAGKVVKCSRLSELCECLENKVDERNVDNGGIACEG